jgi:hypothetical protein
MSGKTLAKTKDGEGRYGLLLLVLIANYLLSAFSGGKVAEGVQVGLVAVVLVLALRSSPLPGRWPLVIGAVTVAGSAVSIGVSLSAPETGVGAAELWKALLLLVTAVLIVRRVLARPAITIQSIYGALSAYLVAGLMFAAIYAAIAHLGPSPFFADGQPASTQTFQYFSFTTLTTLGYGDFTAASNGARAVAVLEALTGQVYLATLVARLVAGFRVSGRQDGAPGRSSPRRPPRRSPRDVRDFRGVRGAPGIRPANGKVAYSRARVGRRPRR